MIKFANIQYLWTFITILILILSVFIYYRMNKIYLKRFSNSDTLKRIIDGEGIKRRKIKDVLIICGIFFLIIALIGPQIGTKLQLVKRKGVDIVICFDTSLSMKAEDVTPNRLVRAKYEVSKLIDKLKGDRVGLVAFAGISYPVCPLTLDYSAAKLFLDLIDTDIIGVQGTAIAEALNTAFNIFDKSKESGGTKSKVVILISDGEDHEGDIEKSIEQARNNNVIVYTVGVGSYSGAPIPIYDKHGNKTGFKKDKDGKIVITHLSDAVLKKIAVETGGKYYHLGTEATVFNNIYDDIFKLDKKELWTHEYSGFKHRYQIFLIIGLLLILSEFFILEKKVTR